jgi:hypothetical protein
VRLLDQQARGQQAGDALASGGGGTFATDDDPELVKAAVPSAEADGKPVAESPNTAAALGGFEWFLPSTLRLCAGGR